MGGSARVDGRIDKCAPFSHHTIAGHTFIRSGMRARPLSHQVLRCVLWMSLGILAWPRPARDSWFRYRNWLTCRRVLLAKRLHQFHAAVGAAFLYASPGGGTCMSSSGVSAWCLRVVCRGPAATHAARAKSCAMGFRSVWERACRQVHSWAGHLSGAPPHNLVAEGMRWKDPFWLHTSQSVAEG